MAKTDTRELIGKVIAGLQDLVERYDEVVEVTAQINTVKTSLASVNAEHEKALAELETQRTIVASAKEEAERTKRVTEDLAGRAHAELAELAQQRDARQAEINAQMALHNNIVASLGSLKAKVDAGLQEKLN
jgi:septal ring factor EnvC (AmiA/AmiB activator)